MLDDPPRRKRVSKIVLGIAVARPQLSQRQRVRQRVRDAPETLRTRASVSWAMLPPSAADRDADHVGRAILPLGP